MLGILSNGTRRPGRRKSHLYAVTAAVAAVAALLAGCTGGTASNTHSAAAKQVLRYAMLGAPQTLDPAQGSAAPYSAVRVLTNEPFIAQKADGTLTPGLATKWGYIGAGNKEFQFTLRSGAKFSDGEALTADAAKKWLLYFAKGTAADRTMMGGGEAGPFASIDSDGKLTVTLHLNAPNPIVPYILSSATAWSAVSAPACVDDPQRLASESCGVGPYVLDKSQTVTGSKYTMVPNKNYFDSSKQVWSSVVASYIGNATSSFQAMQSGQVDVMIGDASTDDAAKAAGIKVLAIQGPQFGYSLDVGGKVTGPLADTRVRQALNYAVDRKTLMSTILKGTATDTLLSSDGQPAKSKNYYPYDPAKAKSLLKEAGYANGFDVTLSTAALFGSRGEPLANGVAKYLGAVGVKVTVQTYSTPGDWIQSYSAHPTGLMIAANVTNQSMYMNIQPFLPGGQYNQTDGGWSDSTLNDLFQSGSTATSAEQPKYWQGVTDRVAKQAYWLPVGQETSHIYTNDKVTDVVVGGDFQLANSWRPVQ